MANPEKKMIDLKEVEVIRVDGKKEVVDLSKSIASRLYDNASNVEEASAAMDLFKNGKVELTETVKNAILNLTGYTWPIRQALLKILGHESK